MLGLIGYVVIASEGAPGGLLDVNPGLIFWTVVTFLILLFILKKTAWKPILAALDQRENSIKEALEKAEVAKKEAEQLLLQNQANMNKAEEDVKRRIDEAKDYAEKLKEELVAKNKDEAKKILDNAKMEIERRKTEALVELKNYVADLSINAAEKILREKLDTNTQKQVVDKYLKEIGEN